MNAFPAEPDTWLVEIDSTGEARKVQRVVGWLYVTGHLAYPLTPSGHDGIKEKRAVLHPDLTVSSPGDCMVYDSLKGWTNAQRIKPTTEHEDLI